MPRLLKPPSALAINDPARIALRRQRRNATRTVLRQARTAANHALGLNRHGFPPKQGRRRMPLTWGQYHPAYRDALLRYKEHGSCQLGPHTLPRARALRAKFYNYRKAVYAGVKSEADYDPILFDLIDIFTEIVLSIVRREGTDQYMVQLSKDPMIESLEGSTDEP